MDQSEAGTLSQRVFLTLSAQRGDAAQSSEARLLHIYHMITVKGTAYFER